MDGKVTIGGMERDLSGALPLKIRDWKALKEKGVSVKEMGNLDVIGMADMAAYVLKKAGYTVDPDDMNIREVASVLNAVTESEGVNIDRPT